MALDLKTIGRRVSGAFWAAFPPCLGMTIALRPWDGGVVLLSEWKLWTVTVSLSLLTGFMAATREERFRR